MASLPVDPACLVDVTDDVSRKPFPLAVAARNVLFSQCFRHFLNSKDGDAVLDAHTVPKPVSTRVARIRFEKNG